MIVMFQGTYTANNCVTGAIATMAAMSAIRCNRKTLIIQLTDAGKNEIENLLVGKQKEEGEIIEGGKVYHLDDRGIDALMRRADVQKLVKDHFDSSCEPLLNIENMLDIAGITQKEDFVESLTIKSVSKIIERSKEVYDNVFILLDGQNKEIMKELLDLCDHYVTCVTQGSIKEECNHSEVSKELKLITNYDNMSAFSITYMKKLYGVRKIYKIPHNTGYSDACIFGTLLTFISRNANNPSNDDNFDFMHALEEFITVLLGKNVLNEADDERDCAKLSNENELSKEQELSDFSDIDIEEETVKKGLFRRKKKITTLVSQKDLTEDEEPAEEVISEDKDVIEEQIIEEDVPKIEPDAKDKKGLQLPSMRKKSKNTPLMTVSTSQTQDQAPAAVEQSKVKWICQGCGCENTGKFCMECGSKKPETKSWFCSECGVKNTGKFCMECGWKKE